ncbi:DUF2931 family protein [Flavobacterium sp. ZT3R18]|uniref:DUF2931 family protein n=1 Tax=Flavobacterium sp. ZT3R18 TaxID=2594429 RepID=UPI00117AD886|nr:DUF2931 family protein [Flavobacterium sp. ZT3R18]TRX30457.1 DUF2931 family protein [Flavobacterium sp. ZT3R18]
MKIIKIHLYALALLLTITTACQNKKDKEDMNEPKFEYEATANASLGYPIEVYKGGLESQSSFSGLSIGIATGKSGWGEAGSGMGSSEATVPNRLNLIWMSYAEATLYSIDCTIDHDKMVKLFKEGYPSYGSLIDFGKHEKDYYRYIITGFAPGGVVVIWLYGPGKQVEIGRYLGVKTKISQAEINTLDNHERLLFDESWRKDIMSNTSIIPLEIQEANKKKSIPYGLWDIYREKYYWRPTAIVQNEGKMDEFSFDMYNGEKDELFGDSFIKNEFLKRATPNGFSMSWKDKAGQRYAGIADFDENEIFAAFQEIYKDNKEGKVEIEFRVSSFNDDLTVRLKGNDKEIALVKCKIDVFKSKRK